MLGLADKARQLLKSRIGNMLMVGALATPILIGGAAVAVDLSRAVGFKAALQSGADAAALSSARELALRSTTAESVDVAARGYMTEQLARSYGDSSLQISSSILRDRSGVEVRATGRLPVLFGKMFGWPVVTAQVTATARTAGSTPLCMLVLDPTGHSSFHLRVNAQLEANGCSIVVNSTHNNAIMVNNQSKLIAEAVCTVGGYGGNKSRFNPAPTTDCPALADPLESRTFPTAGPCNHTNLKVRGQGPRTLNPGTYCGGIDIEGAVQVTLNPGAYFIKDGTLEVEDTASLTGEYVTFVFSGTGARFSFGRDSSIDLKASSTGPFAGFLFVSDHVGASENYKIFSNDARNLLGTVYLPNDNLIVETEAPIADESAFTVLVVRTFLGRERPRMVLNSDYDATDVPVPNGVGPRSASPFLTE